MWKVVYGILVLVFLPLFFGCSSNSLTNLASPFVPVSAPISVSAQFMNIWYNSGISIYCPASNNYYIDHSGFCSAQVVLFDKQAAVTNASITLVGPGYSVPLPYGGGGAYFLNLAAFVTTYGSGPISFVYQPGALYTLNIQTPSQKLSASVTAPGNISIAADGSSCQWQYGGNNDSVYVQTYPVQTNNTLQIQTTYQSQNGVKSPFAIPSTAYPNPVTYNISVKTDNVTTITNGTGEFDISDGYGTSVAK